MQDYTDQTVADAKKALIALGFVEANITSTEEYSDEVDSGKIISQTPATDDKVVPSEAKIAFVVSKGKEPVTVPNLVGMTSSLAVQSLADIGITSPDITYQYSDQDKGDVIAQSPNSGQQAIPGETTVTLVVSSGIEKVTVPDLTGKTKAEATKALSDLGLTMTTTEEYSDTVKEGSVISNDQTNQEVKKGTAIAVVLSKGKEPEKKTFTVNLTAAFDKDGADTQVIKVSISGADDPTGQVNEVTLTKDSDDYTQAIAITVSGDNKATITITRNNTQVVSQQVDQAKQITIP